MRAFTAVISAMLALGYPFVLYLGLTRWGPRAVGLVVLAVLLPRMLLTLRGTRREHLSHVLRVPLSVAALGLLATVARDGRFLLAMPVLVNGMLLTNFALSLRGPMPLVERFARMQVDSLSPAELVWCRQVTVAWCVFFVVNGIAAGALALLAPLAWWTFYTGVLSYLLIGVMFAVEYVIRSYRFRHYSNALPDRVMAWLLPPRSPA